MDQLVREYRERKKSEKYKELWERNKDEVMKDVKEYGYNPISLWNERQPQIKDVMIDGNRS